MRHISEDEADEKDEPPHSLNCFAPFNLCQHIVQTIHCDINVQKVSFVLCELIKPCYPYYELSGM